MSASAQKKGGNFVWWFMGAAVAVGALVLWFTNDAKERSYRMIDMRSGFYHSADAARKAKQAEIDREWEEKSRPFRVIR